jgi:hypothetical protein
VQLLRFLDFDDFMPFVRPALGAYTMGKLALVTVGTLTKTDRSKGIVRAALGGAGLGMAPLWIRHYKFLSCVRRASVAATTLAQLAGQSLGSRTVRLIL